MTELFDPEDRLAFIAWCYRTWGMETPVSGDTLAMHGRETARYLGGAWDRVNGFRPLPVAFAADALRLGFPIDINSRYPSALISKGVRS